MDSFFFNITDTSYKITHLYKENNSYITRVDISNGIVFFDIFLEKHKDKIFNIKNIDRMVVIPVVKNGNFSIYDNTIQQEYKAKKHDINIYCSSRQNFTLKIEESEKTNIFVLFIADFFLKRYLTKNPNEPINLLYDKIQEEL